MVYREYNKKMELCHLIQIDIINQRYPYGETTSLSTSASHNTSASTDYNSNQPFKRNAVNSASIQHHSMATTASNNRAITSASVNPEYLARA